MSFDTPDATGSHGSAINVEIPDIPEAALTVSNWIVSAKPYHPVWWQYAVSVVRLDELEGWPAPYLQFEGATHEMLIIALNPDEGPHTRAKLAKYAKTGKMPYLTPINVAEQFTATDEEMAELAKISVQAILDGHMTPETADAPDRIRAGWKNALNNTLKHIRGEEHDA